MPPKAGKKTPGPKKRGGRVGRPARNVQRQPKEVEESVKVEEIPVAVEEDVNFEKSVEDSNDDVKEKPSDDSVDAKIEENTAVEEDDPEEEDPVELEEEKLVEDENNMVLLKHKEETKVHKEETKVPVGEFEIGERLDLEDNDPEDEAEEYGSMDYDEKETEEENFQEEFEMEEDPEEANVCEEEGDSVEEMNDGPYELEGMEEDIHGGEGPARLVDAEEQEHHDVFKERRKRKEFEVFVGGLDKDACEDDLRKVFGEVGEVTAVRLMINPLTKKNKGFAFLRFATIEQAKRACSDLKNPMVNGKKCGVTPIQDNDTIFLGNICKTWTKEALKEKLKHYGVDNIEDLTLVEDSNNEGLNRGFAFLEFSSRSDAMDSFKRLQKRDVIFGVDRPAKVSFADSFIDPGDEIMAQVKIIFIDGVPPSWDEDLVRELLKKYGEVEKIELAHNMPAARRKDFGFVTFHTHNAAVICAKNINNTELGEGENKAKVRARLSRPLQRGTGKRISRSDYSPDHGSRYGSKGLWGRTIPPRSLPIRGARGMRGHMPPIDRGLKRSAAFRDRRLVLAKPLRSRPVVPVSRSYDRRPPSGPLYPKSGSKKDYGRREEIPLPRSRTAVDYSSRVMAERNPSYHEAERHPSHRVVERHPSYREVERHSFYKETRRYPLYMDEYPPRGSDYAELPRNTSRSSARRGYDEDNCSQRFERPPPSYHEGHVRDYDSVPGSKRSYGALDDVPPRYVELGACQTRARLEYESSGTIYQYGDNINDRIGRSNMVGNSGNRSSIPSQDSRGLYSHRQDMDYGGGSYSGSDVGGQIYSSSVDDYMSRGRDVGGKTYSSMYPSRGFGGSSYTGGTSGAYY